MAELSDVYKRLDTLGYAVVPEDDVALTFILDAVESEVLDKCNISEVPEELDAVIIDSVSGRFLKQKHDMGLLTGYDFTAPVQSITEGDASVSYKTAESPESAFVEYITKLAGLPIGKLAKYRRLAW